MWAIIKTFFLNNVAKIVEITAAVGGSIVAILTIFNAGKKSEQVKELRAVNKEVEDAHDIEDKNRVLPDGAAADKLRENWSR